MFSGARMTHVAAPRLGGGKSANEAEPARAVVLEDPDVVRDLVHDDEVEVSVVVDVAGPDASRAAPDRILDRGIEGELGLDGRGGQRADHERLESHDHPILHLGRMIPRWWLLLLACAAVRAQTVDADTDGDGLSDFQEIHKYLTDPAKKDTDGDGIPDGDWKERREYAYTVRSLLIVMRPAEVEAMNDDFQDARLVEDHGSYVGVEVIHYPLGTASETIVGNPRWRAEAAALRAWIESGPERRTGTRGCGRRCSPRSARIARRMPSSQFAVGPARPGASDAASALQRGFPTIVSLAELSG